MPWRVLGLLAGAVLVVTVVAPPASAAPRRADLVVTKGSVSVAGNAMTVTVTVRNAGRASARATTAAVWMTGRRAPLATIVVKKLGTSTSRTVVVRSRAPAAVAPGVRVVRVCADETRRVKERSERNNCRAVGRLTSSAPPPPAPVPPPPPVLTVPRPISFGPGDVLDVDDGVATYSAAVPADYDASTPRQLLVWMHGCGGVASGDIWNVRPPNGSSHVAISLGGADGGCWDMTTGPALVREAVRSAKAHFAIDPHRVVLAGYSSGGDLAYRTAFLHSAEFAGVLAQNTAPFRDTGLAPWQALASSVRRFPVVHLLQTGDTTYPRATVLAQTAAMTAAGFPLTVLERPGGHYDSHTVPYLKTLLLPHLTDGWVSP